MTDNPETIQLVRAPAPVPSDAGPAPWPFTNWWIMAPLLAAGLVVFVMIQIRRTRRSRLSDSERAFRGLCRGVPTRFRVVMRELARSHGSASPAAIALSDRALLAAVAGLSPEPGTAQRRVVNELLTSRGLSPLDPSGE